MKLIAPSIPGSEFCYDRSRAIQCSNAAAYHIAATLTAARYKLKPGEVYSTHDCGAYELQYTTAGCYKAVVYRDHIKIKSI